MIRRTHITRTQDNWIKGTVGGYDWIARFLDAPSEFGINGGRVSKLVIWNEIARQTTNSRGFGPDYLLLYDQGWYKLPDENGKRFFESVMKILEPLEYTQYAGRK